MKFWLSLGFIFSYRLLIFSFLKHCLYVLLNQPDLTPLDIPIEKCVNIVKEFFLSLFVIQHFFLFLLIVVMNSNSRVCHPGGPKSYD